jgi:hypothetical protein
MARHVGEPRGSQITGARERPYAPAKDSLARAGEVLKVSRDIPRQAVASSGKFLDDGAACGRAKRLANNRREGKTLRAS